MNRGAVSSSGLCSIARFRAFTSCAARFSSTACRLSDRMSLLHGYSLENVQRPESDYKTVRGAASLMGGILVMGFGDLVEALLMIADDGGFFFPTRVMRMSFEKSVGIASERRFGAFERAASCIMDTWRIECSVGHDYTAVSDRLFPFPILQVRRHFSPNKDTFFPGSTADLY